VKALAEELRTMNIIRHLAQNGSRRSAIDGRTVRHPGYAISQTKRKRIEEVFGWMRPSDCCANCDTAELEKVGWMFTFTAAAAYNLVRIRNLMPQCV
jgi:hypothetical protein